MTTTAPHTTPAEPIKVTVELRPDRLPAPYSGDFIARAQLEHIAPSEKLARLLTKTLGGDHGGLYIIKPAA